MAGEIALTSRRARVVHHVPGRMRIRFERDADVPAAADRLRGRMAEHPGVRSVEAHPRARSVVVSYDAAVLDVQRLLDEGFPAAAVDLLDAGLGAIARGASGTAVGRGVVRAVSGANSQLERSTGGVLDLRDVFPLTLFGFGIHRVLQGNLQSVPWYNLLYYGYSTFVALHGRRGGQTPVEPDAVEILRQRFARGEITRTQYRRMLAELESPGGAERSAESAEAPGEGARGPD